MGIPIGKALQSEPFVLKDGRYIMMNYGVGEKDSFAVYMYSMGGPGGVPLAVVRDGRWVNYFNKKQEIGDPAAVQKYNEVALTIRAKDYDKLAGVLE